MLKRKNLIYSLTGSIIILFMGLIFYQRPSTVEAQTCVPIVRLPSISTYSNSVGNGGPVSVFCPGGSVRTGCSGGGNGTAAQRYIHVRPNGTTGCTAQSDATFSQNTEVYAYCLSP